MKDAHQEDVPDKMSISEEAKIAVYCFLLMFLLTWILDCCEKDYYNFNFIYYWIWRMSNSFTMKNSCFTWFSIFCWIVNEIDIKAIKKKSKVCLSKPLPYKGWEKIRII